MKNILILLIIFSGSYLCLVNEATVNSKALHIGQSWGDVEKLLKEQDLVVLSPRFAMFKERDEAYRTIHLDDNVYAIIVTKLDNPKVSKLMVVFLSGAIGRVPDPLPLEAKEIIFHSKDEYSVKFIRDRRTPEEKQRNDLEFQKKIREGESPALEGSE
jgi:hypothetical protein